MYSSSNGELKGRDTVPSFHVCLPSTRHPRVHTLKTMADQPTHTQMKLTILLKWYLQ